MKQKLEYWSDISFHMKMKKSELIMYFKSIIILLLMQYAYCLLLTTYLKNYVSNTSTVGIPSAVVHAYCLPT